MSSLACFVQSTYCTNVHQHCQSIGREVFIVNLDPAAEHFDYPVSVGEKHDALLRADPHCPE
jgi:hypothetical protein